jgi:hypothetical protein
MSLPTQIIKDHSQIIPKLTNSTQKYIKFARKFIKNYSKDLPIWVKKKLYYRDLLKKLEDMILTYCEWNQRSIDEEYGEMEDILFPIQFAHLTISICENVKWAENYMIPLSVYVEIKQFNRMQFVKVLSKKLPIDIADYILSFVVEADEM